MRRVVLIAAAVLLIAVEAGASPKVRGGDSGNISVTDSRPGDETRTPPPASAGQRWFRYDVILWEPATSSFCVDPRWTRDDGYADRAGRVNFVGRFEAPTGAPRANCPEEAVEVPTARQVAADVWQHVEDLPVPTLSVQPDHAITGKKVYLQIRGERTWSRTIDNPIGDDVVITATSDYVIDWDDPADGAPHTTRSQGGPYPDGDVTHVYTHESPRTEIRVTQRWTARWRAGAAGGTLGQLTTAADPLVLEVRDLQAVRTR